MASGYSPGTSNAVEPRPGNVYLVEERRPRLSYELFDKATASGFEGMVVTRDFPRKVVSERGLGTCKVLWLTNLVGDGRINPTAIGILMNHLRTFIEGQQRSVVILDGLEYLISLNTYDRMLQFMHQLRDVVITNNSVLFVPIDPKTLSERELALLERNLEPIAAATEEELHHEEVLEVDNGELKLLPVRHR